ncbi:MAG: hydroxymethylglutaryl-CoA reductase [Verrucomicrobia bacterium]|nr:hydroxymethylglutaryl-CoA reductase [Verrucomicrobiota bacterium]
MAKDQEFAAIPLEWCGPVLLAGPEVSGEWKLPLATYESPLWPSVNRGARVSREIGGLSVVVVSECMTRSIAVEADSAAVAAETANALHTRLADLRNVTAETSRFAQLQTVHTQIVGRLLFIRFSFTTGDASGHNMATKAADALMNWLLNEYPHLRYTSISGNLCTDKKVSAVNGILGRGKYVVAEATIPAEICAKRLQTTAAKIADLNLKKNWIGTSLAGGIRSANAHFANMLLAFYLATGQDAANIVEGSQGFVHAEATPEGALYFSCTLPNLIMGSVGNGKGLDFVQHNLEKLGCTEERPAGDNARRLAALCAASVWCGELSLLAAQTNPGELMRAHLALERRKKD